MILLKSLKFSSFFKEYSLIGKSKVYIKILLILANLQKFFVQVSIIISNLNILAYFFLDIWILKTLKNYT